jgi:hypothetical protein
MMRIELSILCLILTGMTPISVCSAVENPNILLIMTDDQGYGDLGFHGNETIDTPVVDRLAIQSVR